MNRGLVIYGIFSAAVWLGVAVALANTQREHFHLAGKYSDSEKRWQVSITDDFICGWSPNMDGLWNWHGANIVHISEGNLWVVNIPNWMLILSASMPLIGWAGIARRKWSILKAIREGRCPRCGYDLRATPDRCPECGRLREGSLAVS